MTASAPGAGDEFRRLMSRWPTGVSIVSAREAGRDHGLTVNALLSVALRPPTLLISLANDAETTPIVSRTRAFSVSFLASDQRPISERFASALSSEEKFLGLPILRGPSGLAWIAGAIGHAECHVVEEVPALDHRLFLGEVRSVSFGDDRSPLVFHRSGYAEAVGEGALQLPAARGDRAAARQP